MKNNQENLNTTEKLEAKPVHYETDQKQHPEAPKSKEILSQDLDNRAEEARQEVERIALSVEKKSRDSEKQITSSKKPNSRGSISKKQINDSYKKIIKETQKELSFTSKAFSKFTHIPIVEKTSDFVGSTIAKPNAMLSGAILAFVLTLLTYTIAKKSGYELSGFETIASFAFGWLLGIFYDYIRVLLTGKK